MSDNPWNETTEKPSNDPKLASKIAERDEKWERGILERMVFASIKEQRRSRRWGLVIKFLVLAYLFAMLLVFLPIKKGAINQAALSPHAAVINVNGIISQDSDANADAIAQGLREAFDNSHVRGIILRINSPGGTPTQASLIYDEIKRLRGLYPEIPLYAVIMDMGTSGAYYIASAAEKIYANRTSIVGSIGVIMEGFGFVDLIDKIGVERRVLTSGNRKDILDPYAPLKEEDQEFIQGQLNQIHEIFVRDVKAERGDRLVDNPDLFSGLFWNGEEAVHLGLIDGLGSTGYVVRELIGVEEVVDYTPSVNLLDQLTRHLSTGMVKAAREWIAEPQMY